MSKEKKIYVSSHLGDNGKSYNIYHNIKTGEKIYVGDSDFPPTKENQEKINNGEMLANWCFVTDRMSRLKGLFLTQLESMSLNEIQLKAAKDITHKLVKEEIEDMREFLTNEPYRS